MTQESMATPLSRLAETLIPSEIIKLGNEISERVRQGQKIYNFTIGDFDPTIFPIPAELEEEIISAYRHKKTNYPPANGIAELRSAVSGFLKDRLELEYDPASILIAGGGRPLIYAAYRALCDEGDKIIYPVPSWNNNHYTHFVDGEHVLVETKPENHFLPVAEDLIPHLHGATLLALCSPLNPTGTVFSKEQLSRICEAVIEENKSRSPGSRPLYILYDQIYWTMCYGEARHYDPVSLYPELKETTLYIDGISKAFCATGVRVGWAFGPARVIDKMKGILGHIGAWSPMAEQVATAAFLKNGKAIETYLSATGKEIYDRLQSIYKGIIRLKDEGYPVDAIAPEGAMYLSLKISVKGLKDANGNLISNTADTTAYLLQEASLALVPFSAFGADRESEWYRLSVGTCRTGDIPEMLEKLRLALSGLVR